MCDCIALVNAEMKEHNTQVVSTMFGRPSRMVVSTMQIETGRGKAKAAALIATFCPCCGEKYGAETSPKPTTTPAPERAA